jgi:para-aminobenzoate synthetase/4-amino-4-deoxychorismate lyase
MASSAEYFGFRFDRAAVSSSLERAVEGPRGDGARVRLLLDRDGTPRVETSPPVPPSLGPVRIALDDEPVDPDDVWLFHKTTRRAAYDRRRARRPDVDDVVLVNRSGEVTETTIANLAVHLEGRWVTPPRGSGLLAGTYREVLLREGRLTERRVRIEELLRATEVALVSSGRGWREAVIVA